MIQIVLFATLFVLSIGIFIYRLSYNFKLLRVGQGDDDPRTDNPLARLGYTVMNGLLQPKMLKDRNAAIMHYVIFFGFLMVSLGTLETVVQGFFYQTFNLAELIGGLYPLFLVSQDWGNFLVALAVGYALARRIFFPPPRLQNLNNAAKLDALIILTFILALVTSSLWVLGLQNQLSPHRGLIFSVLFSNIANSIFAIDDLQLAYRVVWWLHCLVLFSFVIFLPFSKHQHLIWVWANMFLKNRNSTGRLRPLVIDEQAESFGVGKVEQFSWKQLLDGLTCVECGRCTEQCPASATAKPLDPRLMVHHLKDATFATNKDRQLIGDIVSVDELWACTTCGACMEACPLDIEHIPAIVDMRRYLTLTEGSFPAELATTFKNLETNSTPWAFSSATRADWAKGLDVKQLKDVKQADYLFWVGCAGSFDNRYKKVSRAIVEILNKAGVSFAILGNEERCSGDTARRLGNEYLANMQIEENINNFKKYQVKNIITGCPHCFNTLKNEYPDYGFTADKVQHHSQFIAELLANNQITTTAKTNETVTIHDSCYLSRHNDIIEQPRVAIANHQTIELSRSKKTSFCCGAGGGRMWMEETTGTRINENRAQEIIDSGAQTAATSCPFCMTMVKDGVTALGKDVVVKDIAEIVADEMVTS